MSANATATIASDSSFLNLNALYLSSDVPEISLKFETSRKAPPNSYHLVLPDPKRLVGADQRSAKPKDQSDYAHIRACEQ